MVLLSVNAVSKAFVMKTVLDNVTLTLQLGQRMGLVGANGSGKSTLLKIIAGDMLPDSGTVTLMKGARVGVLTQHADIEGDLTVKEELERVFEPVRQMEARLREMEHEMANVHEDEIAFRRISDEYARLTDRFEEAGGYEWPSRIQGVLAGLGFADDKRDQVASLLSGGEKTRLCLARLLLTQPDLLMLDEPTNHLDLNSTAWLEDTLKRYRGTVIVISHDRYFMNAVCGQMAEISMHHLSQYEGNYDVFAQKRQAERERQEKEYRVQQAEIARQEAIIARYRMYNTERSVRAAESREKHLDKIERVERPMEEKKVRFAFEARRRTGEDVLILKGLSKGYGGRTLFEDFDLHLRAGDRVAIIGPNGVGKTTLLRCVVGQERPDTGRTVFGSNVDMGYYDQQQWGLHPEKDIMAEVWDDFPRLEPGEVRSVLALFLFLGEEVFKKVSTLSGGEMGRIALAKLMLKRDNLLILDEPTNHLDMDSREVLEGALRDFEGTILTVSHDRYFINKIATRVIEMTPDGAIEYLGNYDDYLEKKSLDAERASNPLESGVTRTQLEREKRKKRLIAAGAKRLQEMVLQSEQAISDAEERLEHLETLMADPQTYRDNDKAARVTREHKALKARIETLYEQWEELSDAAATGKS